MAKPGEGFTGEAGNPPVPEVRKKARKTADILPGDVITVAMTVVEVARGADGVVLFMADATGNTHVLRRGPGDSIDGVDRPPNPTIPFNGPGFAGGMSRGPV